MATTLALIGQGLRQLGHRVWPGRVARRAFLVRDELAAACRAYIRLVEVYYFGGRVPLYTYCAIGILNSAERGDLPPMMAVGSSLLAGIFSLIPFRRGARYYITRALESYHSFEDVEARLFILLVIGYISGGIGDWKEFEHAFSETVQISKKFGHRRRLADGLNSLIYLHLLQGHYGSLAAAVEALASVVQDVGDPRYRVYLLAGRTYFHIHAGEFGHALECLGDAQSILSAHPEIGDVNQKLEIYGLLSIAHLRALQPDKAIKSATHALELSTSSYPSVYHALSGYTGPAEVLLSLWERDPMRADLPELARKACGQLGRYARIFPIGEPRFRLSKGRYQWLRQKHTKALQSWQRGLAAADQLSMLNEQGRAHYEIARHLEPKSAERRAHLEHAHQIFTQCSETYYRGLVEELTAGH
jgi:tetratricopeptide (TPR) repeat protein